MHTIPQNSTEFAIILTEPYSSESTIYHPHTFVPADIINENIQKSHWKSVPITHDYHKDLCQIVLEGNDLHLADN